jgi:starvation-inducible DNA-binding protein
MRSQYAPSGIDPDTAEEVSEMLQDRLVSLLDMGLVLKHAHWNVVGPGFMSVHELMDEQVESVRQMSDELAERIATLGGIPNGLAGFITDRRTWDDYAVGRATVEAHLGALDKVYDGIIADHRKAIHRTEGKDIVTSDLLTEQCRKLELMQWFVRAHIETTSGSLPTTNEESLLDAAAAAAIADPLR